MQIIRRSATLFYILMSAIVGGGVAIVVARELPYGGWIGLPVALLVFWLGMRKSIRRLRSARMQLASGDRRWLQNHVPFYSELAPDARDRFGRDGRFVLDEWQFEGVRGVETTAELCVAVAAGVALLMHGRPEW